MALNLLNRFSNDIAAVTSRVRPSLVQITGKRGNLGAGTIWHPDGLIITNAHVIRDPQLTVLLPDGHEYPAQILARSREDDLAALAIQTTDLPTIKIGDSKQIRPGHWVIALGHPWGVTDSVTAGTVIGTGKNLPEVARGRDWIALDLRLRPGHSGGPLVDVTGKLIGINTMITGPEVGFAIPIHIVTRFLRETIGSHASAMKPETV
jgi:S1-C subfamily serine protease